ncbi:MAG TPA: ABC transporter ATP-binding protein [Terriglobales bacterium]|nr:ABC transporter ATP-binding protein [Terriglobales bacterium]
MADAHHEEEVLGKAYDSRLMKRLLTYLAPYKWQTIVAIIAILLKAGADVFGPYLTKVAIDKYLASSRAASHHPFLDSWLSSRPLVGIAQITALYISLLALSFCMEFLQTYYMQWVGQKAIFDLRSQIFAHMQRLQVGFFDRNPVGRLVTRVTTDVDAVNEMFTSGVVSIFEDVFVLAGIVAIMLWMKWWLALITFAVLPLIFWATMIFRRSVRESYRRIRVAIARINAYLQEHVSGIMVLQLFNREERAYKSFEEVNALHMEAFKDAILAHAVYYPVIEILSAIAIASVIWFGGRRALVDAGLLGTLVAFIQYAQRFFRPIQDLSEKYNILQSAMASSERIFKLLDTLVEVASPAAPQHVEGPGRIEFQSVWFAYDRVKAKKHGSNGYSGENLDHETNTSQPEWVLRDVSFTIEPGETVAIVGHTGAGKTTLISLLLRFYDIQRGSIRIDGIDIRNMDLGELRRRYGVVLQDPFLFSGTIRDNIRLGSKWITEQMVERAADDVNIGEFIRSLPRGFDEPVRERGSTLSTGQKQLISFARALAHQPRILILDEATSSVDTDTELRVREALTAMVEGRTSIIIAHRLSTVQRADKILVMHKAQLREMGTHQELLARRGIYWKLYQLQYKDQEILIGSGTVIAGDD